MFHHPAWAVGSYSSGLPARGNSPNLSQPNQVADHQSPCITLLSRPQATDMDTSNMFPYVRAALIGHASRNHNTNTRNSRRRGSCAQLYSECPAHPDDIVNYLNNHKGGLVNQERSCVVKAY